MLEMVVVAVLAAPDCVATDAETSLATPAFVVAAEASSLTCAVVALFKMSLILAPSLAAVSEAVLAALAAVEATTDAELANALAPDFAKSLAALAALDAAVEADEAVVAAVLIAALTLLIEVTASPNEPSLG